MAISAEELNIILAAKDREFAKAMAANARRVQNFESSAKKNLGGVSKSFDLMGTAASKLGLTLSAGALATGMVASIKNAIDAGAAISNLSAVAGVGTTEFQKFAIAAKTVGIEQDKLADILKDVNDKFGDYAATGAGPLADFFDNIAPKVGLTKEAFAGLSSDQALGKYVQALQDAGVNQQEMTFYMEALASDATALSPLLTNNASALTAIGDSAAATGQILDESMIAKSKAMQERWTTVLSVMTANWNNFWLTVAAGIDNLFEISAGAQLGGITGEINSTIEELQAAQDNLSSLEGEDANIMYGAVQANVLRERAINDVNSLSDRLQALHQEAATLQDQIQSTQTRTPPVVNTAGSGTTSAGGGGGGGADAAQKAKEAFQSLMATLDDTTKANKEFSDAQKVVNDALSAGVITQQEANMALEILSTRLRTATGEAVDLSSVASVLESEMTNAFMSIFDGTESTKDAFKSMARAVIAELYKVLVVQKLVGNISGGGILGALGNAFPALQGSASGGALMAGQPSVVGEHGRELFVPSSAGRVLSVPQAKAAMNGGGGVTVVQNINISTGVAQTVRSEIRSLMPQIAESAKAAVFNSQRRSVSGMGY